MDEGTHGRSSTPILARWRALSPWTQYLTGAALLCGGSLLRTSVPIEWGFVGAALQTVCWSLPIVALSIWRDVFGHRWGGAQVAAAVWVGVACGVLVCVPTGSVPQALFTGPFCGAVAWMCAEVGIRDHRRRLPPPPVLPPPPAPPRIEA